MAHVAFIALIMRMSFQIKSFPAPLKFTDITLVTAPTSAILPSLPPRGQARNMQAGSASAAGKHMPSNRTGNQQSGFGWPAGQAGRGNAWPPVTSGRLNLKAATTSSFTLSLPGTALPGKGNYMAKANPNAASGMGKYAPGTYRPRFETDQEEGAIGGGIVRIAFNAKNQDISFWTQSVLSRIERYWIIPTMSRVGLAGQVEITLTIDQRGRQLALEIVRSSAHEMLDQAALNAVKASLPFPPLPENIAGKAFRFNFVFTYNG
jgi:TonB family protein